MNYKQVLFGLATNVPGVYNLFAGTGGTNSARYCYAVWMRHLVMARASGLTSGLPRDVAELGPGDSLGIGLAALISGVETYHALDVVPFAEGGRNLAIFDELVGLFEQRAPIPDRSEFPLVGPVLPAYEFPAQILTAEWLAAALTDERIGTLRAALVQVMERHGQTKQIVYAAPWSDPAVMAPESVDMLYSQAVLEHVNEPEAIYRSIYGWLRPGGWMSHEIDFTSHGIAAPWNGHWALSRRMWKVVVGKRPYLLNRQPWSAHVKLLEDCGFEVVRAIKVVDQNGLERSRLAPEFKDVTDDDLLTAAAFFQAVKRAPAQPQA